MAGKPRKKAQHEEVYHQEPQAAAVDTESTETVEIAKEEDVRVHATEDTKSRGSRPSKLPESYRAVRLVIDRDVFDDHLYHTGIWRRGQVKLVPRDRAQQLENHADVWAPEEERNGHFEVVEPFDGEANEEDIATDWRNMPKFEQLSKDELVTFALAEFGATLQGSRDEMLTEINKLAGMRKYFS